MKCIRENALRKVGKKMREDEKGKVRKF